MLPGTLVIWSCWGTSPLVSAQVLVCKWALNSEPSASQPSLLQTEPALPHFWDDSMSGAWWWKLWAIKTKKTRLLFQQKTELFKGRIHCRVSRDKKLRLLTGKRNGKEEKALGRSNPPNTGRDQGKVDSIALPGEVVTRPWILGAAALNPPLTIMNPSYALSPATTQAATPPKRNARSPQICRNLTDKHSCLTFCDYSWRHGLPALTLEAPDLDWFREPKSICLNLPVLLKWLIIFRLLFCPQIYAALNIFFGMASIGLLTVVAIDRYLTICRPDIGILTSCSI